MSRIALIDPEQAQGKAKEVLDKIKAKMGGKVPNIFRAMAASPSLVEAYLAFSGALAHSALGPKLREKIALGIAEDNRCDYCLAAHSFIGKAGGLSEGDIDESRSFRSSDPKEQAVLSFARTMIKSRGNVSDEEVKKLRGLGYTEAEIVDLVGVVCLNIFTNYLNHVADTAIDFPKVKALSGTKLA